MWLWSTQNWTLKRLLQHIQVLTTYLQYLVLSRITLQMHFRALTFASHLDCIDHWLCIEQVGMFHARSTCTNRRQIFTRKYLSYPVKNAETGKLKYNWANISSFCFSTYFIRRANDQLEQTGQYHIAKKKIPSVLGPVQV